MAVPVSVLAAPHARPLAAAAEITALILRDAPEIRHPLDRLLVAMQSGPKKAEVILLGQRDPRCRH